MALTSLTEDDIKELLNIVKADGFIAISTACYPGGCQIIGSDFIRYLSSGDGISTVTESCISVMRLAPL